MILIYEGRNRGGIWLDLNWIKVWIILENVFYCVYLFIILIDVKIKDCVWIDFCLKIWSLLSV